MLGHKNLGSRGRKESAKMAKIKKLRKNYPYTYVRTSVMRSLLLKKEEYHKLMKMSLPEIARYLEESEYKKEIDHLANRHSGVELLELSINKNLVNSFNKLKRIAPPELRLVIFIYLKRIDIENIKKLLRGKYSSADEYRVLSSLQPAGILGEQALENLWKKDSVEAILRSLRIVDRKRLEEPINNFRQEGKLIEIESELDKIYFEEVMEFSKTLPVQGKFFREFLELEMEIKDMLTIMMLKRENLEARRIKGHLITPKYSKRNKLLNAMLRARDMEALVSYLETTHYGPFLKDGIERLRKESTLLNLEKDIRLYLLRKTSIFTHQNPLSIKNIFAYMFSKKNEADNLRKIVKGKELGIGENFIESMLVI